jgi:hypothetical protein
VCVCVCVSAHLLCVGAGRWVARRVPGGVGAVRLAALGGTTQAVAVAAAPAPAATAEKEEDHEKEQQTEEEQQQEEEEQEEDICPPLPPRRFKGAGFRQVLLGVESVLYVARAQAAFSPGAAPPPGGGEGSEGGQADWSAEEDLPFEVGDEIEVQELTFRPGASATARRHGARGTAEVVRAAPGVCLPAFLTRPGLGLDWVLLT